MFRATILLYEKEDRYESIEMELVSELQKVGVACDFASQSLQDLAMDPQKVAQYVTENPSDAWIVCAASREILEWFADQSFPALALYGRFSGIPIAVACPRASKAMTKCVKRLAELGHQRIVMLARKERRKPNPALFEQNFLNALKSHGLPSGNDNLPDWEENLKGFRACLDSLFSQTMQAPPTALLLQESQFVMATQQYLVQRGIAIPKHVSLYCGDYDSNFEWCEPKIAHARWNTKEVVKRVVSWAGNVSTGKEDKRQILIDAEFIEGGTIGPAPQSRNNEAIGKVW